MKITVEFSLWASNVKKKTVKLAMAAAARRSK
jgi:hypothetical protein